MTCPVRTALRWLAHPVTVVATAVLLLNDHVWKAAFPGLVTGKLSDVAGLVVAPPLVALVLAAAVPRLRPRTSAAAAIAVVAVGFVAVKALPAAAAWASAAWSVLDGPSVIRADPTDLCVVPAAALACLPWRAARDSPASPRRPHRVAVLVVLPAAALAVAATSAPTYDDAVTVAPWRGGFVVGIGNAYVKNGSRSVRYHLETRDGGATFSLPATGDRPPDAPPAVSACSTAVPRHCFRVVPGHLRVQETDDGGGAWRDAWRVDDRDRARLAEGFPGLGDISTYLSSRGLAVQDRPGGGLIVLVADGRDGLARRDPTGAWARIGFGTRIGEGYRLDDPPLPIPPATPVTIGRTVPTQLAVALLVAAGVVFLACAVAGLRSGRRWPAAVAVPWLALSGTAVLIASHRAVGGGDGVDWLLWLLAAGVLAGSPVALLAVLAGTGALRSRGSAVIALTAAASGTVVAGLLVGEAVTGRPPAWLAEPLAAFTAGVATLVAAFLGARYARVLAWVAPPPHDPAPPGPVPPDPTPPGPARHGSGRPPPRAQGRSPRAR